MQKVSLFIFFILVGTFCVAQSPLEEPYKSRLDSLNQILNRPNLPDSSRARAYVMLTEKVYWDFQNFDTIEYLCNQTIEICNALIGAGSSKTMEGTGIFYTKALALNNLAQVIGGKGNYQKQQQLFHQSIQNYSKTSSKKGLAEAYTNLAWFKNSEYVKQPDSTVFYIHKAIPLHKSNHLTQRLIRQNYVPLGKFYLAANSTDSGLYYFRQAIELENRNPQRLSIIIYMIQDRGIPDEVLVEIGDTIYKSVSDSITARGVKKIYNYLGQYFRYKGNFTSSLQYYLQSNKISHKYHFIPEYINLGHLYNTAGDDTSAVNFYKKALIYAEDTLTPAHENYLDFSAWAMVHIGSSLFASNPDSGLFLIQSAIRNWKQAGKGHREWGALSYAYSKLSDYYISKDAYGRALIITDTIAFWNNEEPTNNANYERISAYCHYYLGNLDSALMLARRWLGMSKEGHVGGYKHTGSQAGAYALLSKIYAKRDEDGLALKYRITADSLKDILLNRKDLAAIAHHRQQSMLAKQKLEDGLRLKKEEQRKLLYAAGGILLLILAVGLFSRLRFVRKSKAIIEKERDRSDSLLHNILPAEVAAELKEKGESEARDYDNVTVLFTDFVEFTQTAEKLTAKELVSEINACFKAFDGIIQKYRIEKIKTIGDAYMAAGGLHSPRTANPADVVRAALEMQKFMLNRATERVYNGQPAFEMRVGIHTGPVVAGIVGVKKFQYDIWGDTVNTASRMESSGEVGKVNISHKTYELIKTDTSFFFEPRGKIEVKGKGEMEMWFVETSS